MAREVVTNEGTVGMNAGEPETARGAWEVAPSSPLLRCLGRGGAGAVRSPVAQRVPCARSGNSGVAPHSPEPPKASRAGDAVRLAF